MSYQNLDPAGAKALLESPHPAGGDRFLIDVRTPEEFDAGHVPGAYNIPFVFRSPGGMQPNAEFVATLEKHFKKDASLVFQ